MHRVTLAAIACLVLAGWIGIGIGAEEKPAFPAIGDKTLVAWVYVDDLKQGGGSALTIEDGNDLFDAIVFGERTPGRWMAGSNFFSRTQSPEAQESNSRETADPETLVEMAIVYRGKHITIYRNAKEYVGYPIGETLTFREQSFAVMGLRHVATGDGACFHGKIEDARIYNVALTPNQVAALKPNEPSDPAPLAWWDFEEDGAKEAIGTFPNTKLFGKAKVAGGMLHLDGRGSYLISARGEVPRRPGSFAARAGGDLIADTRALRARLLADPQRPRYHFVSPAGVCHPFDPNGAIFWKGRYHLMYIFQNEKGHCWGHVSSTDLLHWRHHPPALEPGEGDMGIFSGGASLDKNGVPTITYWGLGNPRGICIATSTDDLIETWTKSPHNPVIRETAPGLGDDNTLRIRPPEELALLRYNPRKVENLVVPADGELPLEGIAGSSIELAVQMAPEGAGQFGLKLCSSPGGEEQTLVFYDAAEKKLKIDTTKSSLGEGPKSVEAGPFELKPGEPLKLRVFVDRSVVEVFANDRQAVMRRIYPTRRDSLGVALFSRGGSASVKRFEAWDMAAANPW